MNNLFAVYDSCSAIFGDPFVAVNEASAKRVFEHALSNPDIPKFIRDDAVLYCIGCYDKETGYVSYDSAPYVVCRGSSVIVPGVTCETPPNHACETPPNLACDTPPELEVFHNEE